ncbi:MAG TPA: protein kinase [Gemmataceae bacterium]|nr:protein kinase [Gemmataceae bacterium]
MRGIGLLKCIGKILVRAGGNAVGFGVAGDLAVGIGEEAWKEWNREKNEQQRRAEVEAIVRMAADEFRQQVADVVREVAAGQSVAVQQQVSRCLEELPDLLRLSLRRPEDPSGLSVPPALPLRQAQDLVSLLRPTADPPPATVTLTQIAGPLQGRQVVFTERASCILGRDDDCDPHFPTDSKEHEVHRLISRHHCLIDVNPPDVCVRDLGSRNGTFVNDDMIGQRKTEEERGKPLPERALKDGDELRLGHRESAVFRVSIIVPARCLECGTAIADDGKAACELSPGVYRCPRCRAKAAAAGRPQPGRTCTRCGRDVSGEAGADRPGEFVCAACRTASDRPTVSGYTILGKLGQGGMGAVWKARHEESKRLVAIKVMLPQVAADERAVKQFLREMALTRMLNHRNVVRLWDAGYSQGTFFLTLEFCDGGSVANLLRQRGGTLPADEAVEITLQALEGLHHAHTGLGPGKVLVHRDISPDNLFLSGQGSARVVKVGDYGLAKAFDDAGLSGSTRTGEAAGKPYFMPQQQVIHYKKVGPEVDVWAMAASLYCMLTGFVPRNFEGRDPWIAVLETAPVPIRERKASLPAKLAVVIDQALVDSKDLHFRTAAAFLDALEEAV